VDFGGTGRGLEGAGVSLKEKTTRPRRSAAARRWRSPEGVRKPGALWAADEQRRRWSPAPPHRPPDPASLLLGGTTHLMSLFPRGLCLSTESVRVPPVPWVGKLDIRSVVLTKRPHITSGAGGRCGGAGRSIGTVERGLPGASLPRCGGCAV